MGQKPLSAEKKDKLARYLNSAPAKSDPPNWQFEENARLIGIIEEEKTKLNPVGDMQKMLVVVDLNEEPHSVWVNKHLAKLLAAHKAMIGSLIDIQCGAKVTSKSGHEYTQIDAKIEN